jgi:hypothetical protein
MAMAEETRGKLLFFPHAEEVIREREDRLAGAKRVLDQIDALTEALHGVSEGHRSNARRYLLAELDVRHVLLRQLLENA